MICSILNPYPNGHCIDGSKLPEFKFTFCGDYTNYVEFYICDYETRKRQLNIHHDSGEYSNGFYNGEEIGIKNWNGTLGQNSDYIWYAKLYENVDIANGYFPTQYISSGKFVKCPYQFVKVEDFPTTLGKNYIPVDSVVNIETPCYTYVDGKGYKSVSTIDNLVQNIANVKALIKLGSKYTEMPQLGDEVVICKYKTSTTVAMDEVRDNAANCVYVEPNLSIDYSSHSINDVDIYNSYIKIGNSYYGITKYYPRTGIIILDTTAPTIDDGMTYEIYSCVYQTPDYYFTTKAVPKVTPSMKFADEVIKCTASIATAGNYPIKYYYWTIYKNGVEVDQSEKIYSGRLEYLFREIESDTEYTGKITVVTQDNVEVTSDIIGCVYVTTSNGIKSLYARFDASKGAVKLTWENVSTDIVGYIILRKSGDDVKYLQTINNKTTVFYDYSCANDTEYEYIVVPKSQTSVFKEVSVKITPQFEDLYIYFLSEEAYTRPSTSITDTRIFYEYMHGDMQYSVRSTWLIELNPELGEIIHNIYRNADNTYKGKPAITYGNMNFDSFTLKFTLGQISCPSYQWVGYDQRAFERWKEQINSKLPVLIKDTKGNVWFGAITSHSFEIDYSNVKYKPYDITVDFSQTRDMSKTRIIDI